MLTFPGSSSYFEVGLVPYGKGARLHVGEQQGTGSSVVTPAAAEQSAKNLQQTFGVHYALAETSAAPRLDVPKSARKPEVYLCGLVGSSVQHEEKHTIDTPFRAVFNARTRELMYGMLRRMYGISP